MLGIDQRMSGHAGGMAYRQVNGTGNRRPSVSAAQDILHPGFPAAQQRFIRLQRLGDFKLALHQALAMAAAHGLLHRQGIGKHLRIFFLQRCNNADGMGFVGLRPHIQIRPHQQPAVEHPGRNRGDLAYRFILGRGFPGIDCQRTAEIPHFLNAAHPGQIALGVQRPKCHPAADVNAVAGGFRRQRQHLCFRMK